MKLFTRQHIVILLCGLALTVLLVAGVLWKAVQEQERQWRISVANTATSIRQQLDDVLMQTEKWTESMSGAAISQAPGALSQQSLVQSSHVWRLDTASGQYVTAPLAYSQGRADFWDPFTGVDFLRYAGFREALLPSLQEKKIQLRQINASFLIPPSWWLLVPIAGDNDITGVVGLNINLDQLAFNKDLGNQQLWLDDEGMSLVAEVESSKHDGIFSVATDESLLSQNISLQLSASHKLGWGDINLLFVYVAAIAGLCTTFLVVLLYNMRQHRNEVVEVKQSRIDAAVSQKTNQLRDQNRRLAVATQHIGLWDWDLGQRFLLSDKAKQTMGYDPSELEDAYSRFAELVHPEDRSAFEQGLRDHLDRKTELNVVVRCRTKSGAWRHLHLQGQAEHDAAGQAQRVAGTLQDVTPVFEREERLKEEKEKAISSSRSKTDFVSNMSREIRTPLNAILGMSDVLLTTQLTAEQRELLGILKNSADAMHLIMNDVQDFANVDRGELAIIETQFDALKMMEDLVALHSIAAYKKGLEIWLRYPTHLPRLLIGDENRLRQVLNNLLSNAVKFTETGEIFVQVEATYTGVDAAQFRFSVNDTGVGIANDQLEGVFDKFTHASGQDGAGLGLAICKQLVELMNGEIGVESESGRGTTFWISLTVPLATEQPAFESPASLKNQHVVLLDDQPTQQLILEELLAGCGMRVEVLMDGSAASEWLAQEKKELPAIILVHHPLQAGGSLEFVDAIGKMGDSAPKLVMLTTADERAQLQDQNIDAFLTKPVRRNALLKELGGQLSYKASNRSVPDPDPGLPPPQAEEITPPSTSTTTGRYRLLVAEDNLMNQKAMSNFLNGLGCQVTFAHNGQDALRLMAKHPFDLVLMDVLMPQLDGLEATRRYRQYERQHGLSKLKIIAMTARGSQKDYDNCLEAGMDDYILKPIQRQSLSDMLSKWLDDFKASE